MRRSIAISSLLLPVALIAAACSNNTGPGGTPPIPHGSIAIVGGASGRGAHAFAPDTLTISLATTGRVTWANQDVGDGVYVGGTHHHMVQDDGLFDLGDLRPGGISSFTFDSVATYHYHCSIHPTMVGVVVVNP